ncbi:DUF6216 family protein [Massilia pinisoli]|uniref:DUF6216 family protein n=1 Tax=Massilia pinisoli TaxID=1772194 RepID=A0ABT1ZZ49_9BURK|nr:DUF6216 family protein [Massilia pinisoli]MCS0584899.1 DUF6216 family protein [Massilia pinisoli]
MDISQGISSLGGILSNGTIMAALGATVLALFVWRRTRSFHPIMSRLWGLFSDRKECDDPTIDSFLKDRSALMQFRFTTGIRAETSREAHAVIDYAKTNRIDLDRIAACGEYFDIAIPALKNEKHLPKKWGLVLLVLSCAVCAITAIAFFFGSLSDQMIVRMKSSGTWFALDATRAKPLFGSNALIFSQCSSDHAQIARETRFTFSEIDILCKEKPESIATYVKSGLPEQRFAFAYVMAIFMYIAIFLFFWSYRGVNARQLHKLIEKGKGPDVTDPVPLVSASAI